MIIVKALDIPRKWRLPDVPAEHEWAVKYQVVVPKTYRQDILSIVHETPLAGRMGVNKTFQILDHFYWPNLRKDVVGYCKSCLAQMVGKPNQTNRQSFKNHSAESLLIV